MTAPSEPRAAQQRLPLPSSEEQAMERNSTTSSAGGTAMRKRSRKTEVEQAEQVAVLRRTKRPRKLAQQPLPVQQSKGRHRRLNSSESGAEEIDNVDGQRDPILYWTKTGHWLEGYSELGDKDMSRLLARQKSSGSLRRKQFAPISTDPASIVPSSTTPNDQRPRDFKSEPYQDPCYKLLLATKGSFMDKSDLGITNEAKKKSCSGAA